MLFRILICFITYCAGAVIDYFWTIFGLFLDFFWNFLTIFFTINTVAAWHVIHLTFRVGSPISPVRPACALLLLTPYMLGVKYALYGSVNSTLRYELGLLVDWGYGPA